MQSFDQCLADLVASGTVTFDVAKAAASNPSDFELKLRMFSSQAGAEEQAPVEEAPEEAPASTELEGLQSGAFDF
jgi:Tfp pilus assembly ATPase PilU